MHKFFWILIQIGLNFTSLVLEAQEMKLDVIGLISGVYDASYVFDVIQLLIELNDDFTAENEPEVLRLNNPLKKVPLVKQAFHENGGRKPHI